MLEKTHFHGSPPDKELVYLLRKEALKEVSLSKLIKLISPNEYTEFKIACYLKLAFGIPLPLVKELASYISIHKSSDENILGHSALRVMESINDNRVTWSAEIPG